MAIVKLITIKSWFRTSLRPTQAQFWDSWDSFWHKSDSIPMSSIEGLENAFDLLEAPVNARIKPEKAETPITGNGIITTLNELLSASYRIKSGMPIITGIIRNPLYYYDGKEITIYNDTDSPITVVHQFNAYGLSRFSLPEEVDLILQPRQMAKFKFVVFINGIARASSQPLLELVSKNFEFGGAIVLPLNAIYSNDSFSGTEITLPYIPSFIHYIAIDGVIYFEPKYSFIDNVITISDIQIDSEIQVDYEYLTQEPIINFDFTSTDWGFTDQAGIEALIGSPVTNFSLVNGRIRCLVTDAITVFDLKGKNITNCNIVPNTVIYLYLGSNQIVTFNPDNLGSVTNLYLNNNQMTLQDYTDSEASFALLPDNGTIYIGGNIDSIAGTNAETILYNKGWSVNI
jgi:hypothetical protein